MRRPRGLGWLLGALRARARAGQARPRLGGRPSRGSLLPQTRKHVCRARPDLGRACGGSQVRAERAAGARSGPTVRREPGPGRAVRREPGPGRRCGGSRTRADGAAGAGPGRAAGADGAAGAGPGPTVRREPGPGRRCGGSQVRADGAAGAGPGPSVRPGTTGPGPTVRPGTTGPGRASGEAGRGTSRIGGLLPWASGVRPGQRNGVARGRRYGFSRAIFAATCASDPRSGDCSRLVSSATVMWSSGYRDRWV